MTGRLVATVAMDGHADGHLTASRDDAAYTATGHVGRVVHGQSADLLLAPAVGDAGESLHLLDLRGTGVTRTPLEVLDHTRRQARIDLEATPAFLVAGPEDWPASSELAVLTSVALAAEHVGMIEAMLEMTGTYAGQRHQFGRPLASFQVIKHRLADMLVDLERSRSAARYAAAMFDQEPASQGSLPPWPERSAPMPSSGPHTTLSSCTVVSGSPGSTRLTSTSAGRSATKRSSARPGCTGPASRSF